MRALIVAPWSFIVKSLRPKVILPNRTLLRCARELSDSPIRMYILENTNIRFTYHNLTDPLFFAC
jgi:hypothetical protein